MQYIFRFKFLFITLLFTNLHVWNNWSIVVASILKIMLEFPFSYTTVLLACEFTSVCMTLKGFWSYVFSSAVLL